MCCAGVNGTCDTGFVCGNATDGGAAVTCVVCGGSGQRCCGGATCDSGLICGGGGNGVARTCQACGGSGQACCPTANGATGPTCGAGFDCVAAGLGGAGTCQACGSTGVRCCGNGAIAARTCNAGLTCDVGTAICQ